MNYFIIYMIIGYLVSGYMCWYYRLSARAVKVSRPRKGDCIGGLLGPFIWPLQIIKHIMDLK